MTLKRLIGIHKNVDFAGLYIGSDDKYDYSVVNIGSNNHSFTRYFGEEGGEYESYPIYCLSKQVPPKWVIDMIAIYLKYHNPDDVLVLEYCQKVGITQKMMYHE